MIQRSATDGTIADEHVVKQSNKKGTLSLANTGDPDSGGSQFFINLADNNFLDWFHKETTSNHVVFGRVLLGMEIVERIGKAEMGDGDRPKRAICVRKVTETLGRGAESMTKPAAAAAGVGDGGAGGGGGGAAAAVAGKAAKGGAAKGEVGEVRQAGDGSGDGWVRTATGWK